jgi:hypothetical protein
VVKTLYGVGCVVGVALPYSQFLPWLAEHGLDPSLLLREAAQSRIAAFAWLDAVASAGVLLIFTFVEGRRLGMPKLWLPVLGTLTVGVSLGLPLFLLLRERHLAGALR